MVTAKLRAGDLSRITDMAEVKGRSLWADARKRFMRNKAAVASLLVLIIITLFSLSGEAIAPWTNEEIDFNVIGSADTKGMPSFESGH